MLILFFLQYSGLIRSVLDWKKKLKLEDIRNKLANPILPVQVYLKSKKGTQDMYNLLNKNNDPQVEKYLGIKSINLKIMSGKNIYSVEPFKITKDSTIHRFQT